MTTHHKNKKMWEYALLAAAIIFLIWLLMRKKNNAIDVSSPQTGASSLLPPNYSFNYDPIVATYSQDPAKFGPMTIDGSVNVNVIGYNGLNQNYMPLFGFVGMAQGELWQ